MLFFYSRSKDKQFTVEFVWNVLLIILNFQDDGRKNIVFLFKKKDKKTLCGRNIFKKRTKFPFVDL